MSCNAVSLNKTPSKCTGYTQPVRTIITILCTRGLSQDRGLLGCDCITGQVPPNALKDDAFNFRVKALHSFKMWRLLAWWHSITSKITSILSYVLSVSETVTHTAQTLDNNSLPAPSGELQNSTQLGIFVSDARSKTIWSVYHIQQIVDVHD